MCCLKSSSIFARALEDAGELNLAKDSPSARIIYWIAMLRNHRTPLTENFVFFLLDVLRFLQVSLHEQFQSSVKWYRAEFSRTFGGCVHDFSAFETSKATICKLLMHFQGFSYSFRLLRPLLCQVNVNLSL